MKLYTFKLKNTEGKEYWHYVDAENLSAAIEHAKKAFEPSGYIVTYVP